MAERRTIANRIDPRKPVEVYTDGSGHTNNGRLGGWGATAIQSRRIVWEAAGTEAGAAADKMELRAIAEALEALPRDAAATVMTDCMWCIHVTGPKGRAWREADRRHGAGAKASHVRLAEHVMTLLEARPRCSLKWIKGHNGNPWNMRAHRLAKGSFQPGGDTPESKKQTAAQRKAARRRARAERRAAIKAGEKNTANNESRRGTLLTEKIESLLQRMSPRNAAIVTERLGAAAPESVRAISSRTGLSKQRIHELEKTTRAALQPELGDAVDGVMTQLMGPSRRRSMVTNRAFSRTLAAIAPGESDAARITRRTIEHASPLVRMRGMRISREHEALAANLRGFALRHADAAGVIRNTQALRGALPDKSWRKQWKPWLTRAAGMTVMNGQWVVKETNLSKVRTTLLSTAEPLTADEIADRAGLTVKEVRGALHARKGCERVDAKRWTTTERVAEPYTSVSRLMKAEIERAGGEMNIGGLAKRLEKWRVDEKTVNTASRNLMFDRRGATVRLQDAAAITAGSIADAMHGTDARKRPYWTFPVTRRNLDGYSVTYMPPAIAHALGCPPGGAKTVPLRHCGGQTEASIGWRLSNNKSATLGRLKSALAAVGAEPGQRVRITIDGSGGIELSVNDPADGVETAAGHAVRTKGHPRRAATPTLGTTPTTEGRAGDEHDTRRRA